MFYDSFPLPNPGLLPSSDWSEYVYMNYFCNEFISKPLRRHWLRLSSQGRSENVNESLWKAETSSVSYFHESSDVPFLFECFKVVIIKEHKDAPLYMLYMLFRGIFNTFHWTMRKKYTSKMSNTEFIVRKWFRNKDVQKTKQNTGPIHVFHSIDLLIGLSVSPVIIL